MIYEQFQEFLAEIYRQLPALAFRLDSANRRRIVKEIRTDAKD